MAARTSDRRDHRGGWPREARRVPNRSPASAFRPARSALADGVESLGLAHLRVRPFSALRPRLLWGPVKRTRTRCLEAQQARQPAGHARGRVDLPGHGLGCSEIWRVHSATSWRRTCSGCSSRATHPAYEALRSVKYGTVPARGGIRRETPRRGAKPDDAAGRLVQCVQPPIGQRDEVRSPLTISGYELDPGNVTDHCCASGVPRDRGAFPSRRRETFP